MMVKRLIAPPHGDAVAFTRTMTAPARERDHPARQSFRFNCAPSAPKKMLAIKGRLPQGHLKPSFGQTFRLHSD
jgi:hypothetical protein